MQAVTAAEDGLIGIDVSGEFQAAANFCGVKNGKVILEPNGDQGGRRVEGESAHVNVH